MRNYLLDYYKVLLAIFVVGIHTSVLIDYCKPLSFLFNLGIFRIAVPTFFLINGYYSLSALSTRQTLKRYVVRVLTLYMFWMALYFPIYIYTHDFSTKNIIWGFVVLLYGYGHLWYLTALIGGVMLLFYLKNRYNKKAILFLSLSLYFIGCIIELGQGYLSTLNHTFFNEILELQMWKLNFIFFAFPFIAIGYYMKKDVHQFNQRFYLWIALLVFSIEIILSYNFFTHGRNMLFSLIIVAPLILSNLMTLNMSSKYKIASNKYLEKLPNSIFYVHGLANFFISLIYININTSYKFIIVSIISVMMAVLLIKLNDKANNTFKDKFI